MAEDKKYYWFRLRKDFFSGHKIKMIEAMDNGSDYLVFYLKLLCESVSHEGRLRFSETVPYSEKMLSVITGTNIDIVKSAMRLFQELELLTIEDDSTIYMNEVVALMGCETAEAIKKRKYRQALKEAKGDKKGTMSRQCPTESRDRDRDKSIDIESIYQSNDNILETDRPTDEYIFFKSSIERFLDDNTGYERDPVADAVRAILERMPATLKVNGKQLTREQVAKRLSENTQFGYEAWQLEYEKVKNDSRVKNFESYFLATLYNLVR